VPKKDESIMPLSFHMTNGQNSALPSNELDCSINEKDHHKLFRHICTLCGGFSCINQFSEYHKDAFLGNGSLSVLVGEIAAVSVSVSPDTAGWKFLGSLRALCDLALIQGGDIAALAD
jgi:hypothetical protein